MVSRSAITEKHFRRWEISQGPSYSPVLSLTGHIHLYLLMCLIDQTTYWSIAAVEMSGLTLSSITQTENENESWPTACQSMGKPCQNRVPENLTAQRISHDTWGHRARSTVVCSLHWAMELDGTSCDLWCTMWHIVRHVVSNSTRQRPCKASVQQSSHYSVSKLSLSPKGCFSDTVTRQFGMKVVFNKLVNSISRLFTRMKATFTFLPLQLLNT